MALDDFIQQSMRGSVKQDGNPANEKDIVDGLVIDGAKKVPSTLVKILGKGPNLSDLGAVSVTAQIDRKESWVDKPISQGAANLAKVPGGVLASIASVLIKNGVITDNAGGVTSSNAMHANEGNLGNMVASVPSGGGGTDHGIG